MTPGPFATLISDDLGQVLPREGGRHDVFFERRRRKPIAKVWAALTQTALSRKHLLEIAAGWHTHLEGLPGAAEGRATPWIIERERVIGARYEAVAPD